MSRLPGPDGILLLDKPAGPTSHDMVALARRAFGERRIGHTGTLDPFASGLLLLCHGRATRLVEYLHDHPKRYEAEARLGVRTSTDDPEGEVVAEDERWRGVTEDGIRTALAALVGPILQRPPVYSAKKVDGRAAHRRARKGEEVELAPVPVQVHAAHLLSWDPPHLRFAVEVSTGTYIRVLGRELAEALGSTAHLTGLRRTGIGPFSLDGALTPDEVEEVTDFGDAWRSPFQALAHLPQVELNPGEVAAIEAGRALDGLGRDPEGGGGGAHPPEGAPLALVHGGELVAVGEWKDGRIHPRKVFPLLGEEAGR